MSEQITGVKTTKGEYLYPIGPYTDFEARVRGKLALQILEEFGSTEGCPGNGNGGQFDGKSVTEVRFHELDQEDDELAGSRGVGEILRNGAIDVVTKGPEKPLHHVYNVGYVISDSEGDMRPFIGHRGTETSAIEASTTELGELVAVLRQAGR